MAALGPGKGNFGANCGEPGATRLVGLRARRWTVVPDGRDAGMLGKFYAEAIETIDPGPMEALEATGASWLQIIAFAIIPQVIPHFVTYNMYRFEVSIRAATVLGLVGAGGVGFHLISSIRLFDYRETAVVLIVIILLVVITDYLGALLRAKII